MELAINPYRIGQTTATRSNDSSESFCDCFFGRVCVFRVDSILNLLRTIIAQRLPFRFCLRHGRHMLDDATEFTPYKIQHTISNILSHVLPHVLALVVARSASECLYGNFTFTLVHMFFCERAANIRSVRKYVRAFTGLDKQAFMHTRKHKRIVLRIL